jgi:hypothetical protein
VGLENWKWQGNGVKIPGKVLCTVIVYVTSKLPNYSHLNIFAVETPK